MASCTCPATFDHRGNVETPSGGEWYNKWTGRLQSRKINSILHAYTYDRAGNLTQESWSGNTRTYQYDALNRLRSVRHNGTLIVRYGYDVLGRRIAKRVYSSITGGTVGLTRYKYHGNHVAFETDSAGTSIGWRYTWGMGTDDLLALRDAAGNHYYTAKDKLGSIRALAERDGTWKYSTRYGPYGEPKTGAGTDPGLRYRWTGREYDPETGWYFHRTRYYAPAMLRFVQEDKIGYGGGANLYAYVAGAVLDARDPSGMLMSWMDIGKGFIPFCTFGGNCLGSDGSVTGEGPAIYLDGVSWGGGGRGGISGIAIGSITGRGYGSLLPGKVVAHGAEAAKIVSDCLKDADCKAWINNWEMVRDAVVQIGTTTLIDEASGKFYFPERDGSRGPLFVGGHNRPYDNGADIWIGLVSNTHPESFGRPEIYAQYGEYQEYHHILGHELMETYLTSHVGWSQTTSHNWARCHYGQAPAGCE